MYVSISDIVYIGRGAQIGEPPNDASETGRVSLIKSKESLENLDWKPVRLGGGSIIRENVNIDLGVNRATTIGEEVYIHSKASINHDCVVKDRVVIGPNACLNGAVVVQEESQIGAMATLHQNIVIGSCSMIGMGCAVMKNVPPYVTVGGNPQIMIGLNNRKIERDIEKGMVQRKDFENYLRYCMEDRLEEFISSEKPCKALENKIRNYLDAVFKK